MRRPRLTALAVIHRHKRQSNHQSNDRREFLVQCADKEAFYRFPGGEIEFGETAAETLLREMREEYELEITVGNLWMVNENFFAYREKTAHGVNLLYLCSLVNNTPVSELRHKEHDDIKLVWRSQADFDRIPLYPQGVENHLNTSVDQVIHLVSYQTAR